MKLAGLSLVLLASLVSGCEKQPSKLDKMAESSAMPSGMVPSGDLEGRVRRIEESLAKREEALSFLDMAFEQQAEAQTKPTADGIYAVDIAPDLALGQVEGSPNALVTIIEAWDFA
jgi:hypothetical protein